MNTTVAVCPNTRQKFDPLHCIPTDWMDNKPPVITCPACGKLHQWRPTQGTLINVDDQGPLG